MAKAKTIGRYSSFDDFANFLAKEAKVACDPIMSPASLQDISEKDIEPKKKGFGANVLLPGTKSEKRPVVKLYQFCQRKGHTLPDCYIFFK